MLPTTTTDMDDDDDPLALRAREVVPTSDDDEREVERAREWGGAYWRQVAERRRLVVDVLPLVRREPRDVVSTDNAVVPSSQLTPVRRNRTRSPQPPTPLPAARLAPRPFPAPPPAPEVQLSAALLAFQNARTFRPRTALQLQPYTRERLAYQAVVRRGGGRGLVRELDVVPNEEDEEDGMYEQDGEMEGQAGSIDMAVSPVLTPLSEDYSQYNAMHPHSPATSPSNRRLQALVKHRVRTEARKAQIERKKKRNEEEHRRQVDRELRERKNAERAAARAERERERERERRQIDPDRPSAIQDATRQKTYAKRPRITGPTTIATPDPPRRKARPVNEADLLRGLPGASGSSSSPSPSPSPARKKVRRRQVTEDETMDIDDHRSDDPEITLVSDSSDDDSTQQAPLPRKNARALNRMLPAIMVKRLKQGEAARPARNRRAEDDEAIEVGRPGRARVRVARAPMRREPLIDESGGDVYGEDEMGIFGDMEMDDQPPPPLSSPPRLRFQASLSPLPTVSGPSSLSTLSSSPSSSSDDGADSVQLLHAGQFSRLLNGERDRRPPGPRPPRKTGGNGLLRAARTARGTVRHRQDGKKDARGKSNGKRQQQSRLPFPLASRPPGGKDGQGAKPRARARARPRLLDDHTIFEVSEDEGPLPMDIQVVDDRAGSPKNAPRAVHRVTRLRVSAHPVTPRAPRTISAIRNDPPATTPTAAIKHKASLWTDLQDFQVDFDVKPLPSGVSFDPATWIGSAGLERYLDGLFGTLTPSPFPPVVVFGMSLTWDMPYAELLQLLPAVMDGVFDQLLAQCNGRAPTEPDYMTSFEFLDRYMVAHAAHHSTADATRLVEEVLERVKGLRSSRRSCPDDRQHLYLLDASLAILKLLLRIYSHWPEAAASPTLETSIQAAAQDIIERLLVFGFDRTMKPLKAIMAFAAEQPVLTDFTAECWITVIHLLRALDARIYTETPTGSSFSKAMDSVVQRLYVENHAGPRASERIWYITFGLAAFHQFGADGITLPDLQDYPQWSLVRKAVSLIKFPVYTEAEEQEKRHQLKSRDKYIKIMVIRCLQLTCTWQWKCDRDSFAIATRDLGNVFKDRHLRNLPNEASSDFPAFIREYDLKRSSEVDIEESTYNLYLQLVCVSASDLIAGARDMKEAEQSVKDVQKLMLSIFPFSPVVPASNGVFSGKQLGALVNRFSALVVAVLFVPSLLEYLLKAAGKWADFNCGDIEVQRIWLRGLMYVGVAARHHQSSVEPVVDRLADIFETVHETKRSLAAHQGDKIKEQERLLILLVSCYRQIIERHCFDREFQQDAAYPDPCLLHKCWTSRLSSTDLITDRRAGLEVIETIQAFLDARNAALPSHIHSTRQQKLSNEESQHSEFDSLGIDFTTEDLMMLGEDSGEMSAIVEKEKALADIIATHISPGIYELLSNTFSSSELSETGSVDVADTQSWISKLTKCWADCASVLVVDHHLREWSFYLGYGKESYERLADENAKRRVGMSFCLNVLHMDPGAFTEHREHFAVLFAQGLVTHQVTIEHEYASALMHIPASREWYLLVGVPVKDWSAETFMAERRDMIGILSVNISQLLQSPRSHAEDKSYVYRLVNILLGTMQHNYQTIPALRTDQRRQYSMFCDDVIGTIRRHNGTAINEMTVNKLKSFPLYTA